VVASAQSGIASLSLFHNIQATVGIFFLFLSSLSIIDAMITISANFFHCFLYSAIFLLVSILV